MNQLNPYEVVPRAPIAEARPTIARRPVLVTIALVLLWILLVCRALGSIGQLNNVTNWSNPYSAAYATYLCAMILVPAFLLVHTAHGGNWARIALLSLYASNLIFRIFLFVNDGQFTTPVAAWLVVPASVEATSLVLLFLPKASCWFRASSLTTPSSGRL